jgi:hypothetical protein
MRSPVLVDVIRTPMGRDVCEAGGLANATIIEKL